MNQIKQSDLKIPKIYNKKFNNKMKFKDQHFNKNQFHNQKINYFSYKKIQNNLNQKMENFKYN